jgi:hypothetical protein
MNIIVASSKNALALIPTRDGDLAEMCGILNRMELFYIIEPFNSARLPQLLREFFGESERVEVG